MRVVDLFVEHQMNLIEELSGREDTEANRKREKILSSFQLDEQAFKQYSKHVYENASEEDVGSCNDVLGPGGRHTVYGVLDNIAGNFRSMEYMIDELGFYEFDDRASQMLQRRGSRDRFNHLENTIEALHSDDKLSPNISDHESKRKVIQNLKELENMLDRLANASK